MHNIIMLLMCIVIVMYPALHLVGFRIPWEMTAKGLCCAVTKESRPRAVSYIVPVPAKDKSLFM